jgi:hypothetical protein
MASTFYQGKKGAVTFGPRVGGVTQPLTEWSLSISTQEIDQSNYDQPTATYAAGIPTAFVSMSGPYPREGMNLQGGKTGTVTLYLDQDSDLGFTLPVLITSLGVRTNTRGVAMVDLSAVCTGNFTDGDAGTSVIEL